MTRRALGSAPTKPGFDRLRDEAEAARLAAEWDKLREPARTQIQVMIEALVAQQIHSDRETKKKPRPGSPDQSRSS